MQYSRTISVVDKRKWGSGPWVTEPDEVLFNYESFECKVIRHTQMGHLAGYVGVDEKHELYGQIGIYCNIEFDLHLGNYTCFQFGRKFIRFRSNYENSQVICSRNVLQLLEEREKILAAKQLSLFEDN